MSNKNQKVCSLCNGTGVEIKEDLDDEYNPTEYSTTCSWCEGTGVEPTTEEWWEGDR